MSQNPVSYEEWGQVANQVSNSDPQVVTDWLNTLTPDTDSDDSEAKDEKED